MAKVSRTRFVMSAEELSTNLSENAGQTEETTAEAEVSSESAASEPSQDSPPQAEVEGDNSSDVSPTVDGQPEASASGHAFRSPEETSDAQASDDQADQTARRRLNPTIKPEEAKPVAMYPESESDDATEEAAGEPDASAFGHAADSPEETSAEQTVAEKSQPVEIPDDDVLGADLEAEIAAAMSQQESSPSAPAADAEQGAGLVQADVEELEKGTRLKGRVESIYDDNVFVDLGLRFSGVVSLRQFESGKHPAVGDELEVIVDRFDEAEGLLFVNLPKGKQRIAGNWEAVAVGQILDCTVTGTNKGGLEVQVSGLRGFLPAGHVDLKYVGNLEGYVGQKLTAEVIEVNPKKRNLVLSRRAYLEREKREAEERLWKTLEVGQTLTGTVKTIKEYGAFIDIGGVDGFLHIGEMSWSRIKHPNEVLQEGQQVEVKVLSLDAEKKRIGLGMRQLVENPWDHAKEKYQVGTTVTGTVTRTTDFGAFIELEPGVEGLVHISELDHRHVKKVTEVLNVGQEIDVHVLEVNPERKRIGLSLKALQEKPGEEEAQDDQEQGGGEEEKPPERKRKRPLKGGIGGEGGGGLFGDPNQFK